LLGVRCNCKRLRIHAQAGRALAGRGRCVGALAAAALLITGSFPMPVNASLAPDTPLNRLLYQNWQTGQGLPQNSVLAIAQTADGYLWLGTEEGLARFDGVRFTVFDKHTPGLLNNQINVLLAARNGDLWIGTDGGGLSLLRNGRFTAYTSRSGLPNDSILSLYRDEDGVLWVGTDGGGLARLENGRFRVFTKTDGLPDDTVCALAGDGHGTLWIGTHAGMGRLFQGRLEAVDQPGLGHAYIRALYAEPAGIVWAGTSDGLWRFGPHQLRRFTTADGLTSNIIFRIYRDRANTLWIGTGTGGLNRFAGGHFSSFTETDGLMGKDVWSILEDNEGILWFGTAGGGLSCLKSGSFEMLMRRDGLASNVTLGIYQDRRGAYWIGSDHGLTRWQNGQATIFTMRNGLPDNLVFTMAEDGSGTLWVGTRRGLGRMAGGRFHTLPGAPSDAVMCSYTDRQGNVWFGARGGLTRFDGHALTTYTTRDGLSNNYVLAITGDRQGDLWIGTGGGGLNRFRDGHFSAYTSKDGLSSNVVWALYADRDGTLWLGTNGGGLSWFHNGKFTNYTSAAGLPDDGIFSIVDDEAGHLWLSSNKGVFEAAKAQLQAFARGSIAGITPEIFSTADGMATAECNGGFQPAAWRDANAEIYFATNKGLAMVDPQHLVRYRSVPRVVIERALVDSKEVPVDRPLVLPPGRAQFEFRFSAPSFLAPDKVQFSYKLEGFDKDWVPAGTRRAAYYTNIPYGEYRFLVRAGIAGDWNTYPAALPITLKPHFWETVRFYVLCGLTAISLCAWLYRRRMNQVRARERKLMDIVHERTYALQESERQLRRSYDELEMRVNQRTEELRLAKEAAEAANRAKSDFLANMSHEVRTPIHGILGMTEIALSTGLSDEQRDYLETVKSSADSLLAIVNDILDFSKIEARKLTIERTTFRLRKELEDLVRPVAVRAQQKELAFESRVDSTIPDQVCGDPLRLRQIVLNLLDNAVKFTPKGGRIGLDVSVNEIASGEAVLHFAVSDTGIGIPPEKQKAIFEAFSQADTSSTRRYGGTGLGLTISYQLAQMMGGRLWVDSEPGRGSTFHLLTPLEITARNAQTAAEPEFAGPVPA
jgi:signal transduction histidine kinase/ligand-binding sensor domain-containing protein